MKFPSSLHFILFCFKSQAKSKNIFFSHEFVESIPFDYCFYSNDSMCVIPDEFICLKSSYFRSFWFRWEKWKQKNTNNNLNIRSFCSALSFTLNSVLFLFKTLIEMKIWIMNNNNNVLSKLYIVHEQRSEVEFDVNTQYYSNTNFFD